MASTIAPRSGTGRSAVRYLDRATGAMRDEPVYGRAALEFLYETAVGRQVERVLPHRALSACIGWLYRLPASRSAIRRFIARLGIDPTEAERPIAQYRSLDAFFSRRLHAGARPVDPDPRRLVMPADGRVLVVPRIDGRAFPVKGRSINLPELLGDASAADVYRDGTALIVRLAPCDYHRFHFPDGGAASAPRRVGGRLHSVHPFALRAGAPSFANRRDVTWLESDAFGHLALIEIGALGVGSIVQTYRPGRVERGAEKGFFHFGGSTVVALVAAGRLTLDDDLVRASAHDIETFVKMGVSVGTAQ